MHGQIIIIRHHFILGLPALYFQLVISTNINVLYAIILYDKIHLVVLYPFIKHSSDVISDIVSVVLWVIS